MNLQLGWSGVFGSFGPCLRNRFRSLPQTSDASGHPDTTNGTAIYATPLTPQTTTPGRFSAVLCQSQTGRVWDGTVRWDMGANRSQGHWAKLPLGCSDQGQSVRDWVMCESFVWLVSVGVIRHGPRILRGLYKLA